MLKLHHDYTIKISMLCIIQYFSTYSTPSLPSFQPQIKHESNHVDIWSMKPQEPLSCRSAVLRATSTWGNPQVGVDPLEPRQAYYSVRKSGSEGSGWVCSPVLASCLHYHSKWLEASLLFSSWLVALVGYSDTWELSWANTTQNHVNYASKIFKVNFITNNHYELFFALTNKCFHAC